MARQLLIRSTTNAVGNDAEKYNRGMAPHAANTQLRDRLAESAAVIQAAIPQRVEAYLKNETSNMSTNWRAARDGVRDLSSRLKLAGAAAAASPGERIVEEEEGAVAGAAEGEGDAGDAWVASPTTGRPRLTSRRRSSITDLLMGGQKQLVQIHPFTGRPFNDLVQMYEAAFALAVPFQEYAEKHWAKPFSGTLHFASVKKPARVYEKLNRA